MRGPFTYACDTEHGCSVQVGEDHRPCVVEVYADGALQLVAATTRLPRFLRQVWQRDRHRMRSDFARWDVVAWYAPSELRAHEEKLWRVEMAGRTGVSLRNRETLRAMRDAVARLKADRRARRASRRAS